MTEPVPPRIESPTSFIAVGSRELIILGVGACLALLIILLDIGLIAKVGMALLIVGLGLSAAFGRDRRTGRTLEQYLLNLLRYYGRARFRQRGTLPPNRAAKAEKPDRPDDSGVVEEAAPARARLTLPSLQVRPLPLGPGLLFAVLSFSFLGMLLVWVWLGGLAEIHLWFGRTRF